MCFMNEYKSTVLIALIIIYNIPVLNSMQVSWLDTIKPRQNKPSLISNKTEQDNASLFSEQSHRGPWSLGNILRDSQNLSSFEKSINSTFPPDQENWRNDVERVEPKTTDTSSMLKAVNFMKKFGYIPKGDQNADFVFSSESVKEKLKLVQKFGAIPETGELDEETLKLISSPRCGVQDVKEYGNRRKKRYIVGGEGWRKRRITYHVANWSPKLWSKKNVQEELRKAFDAWSEYSRLDFVEVNNSSADIIIFFAQYHHYDGYPFDGPGGILAHAYYPYEFEAYGGDVHFDESEAWRYKDVNDEGLDFYTVAVHELGHSLGLAHSHVRSSIMFPYYKGYNPHLALDYDDVMGMWELYIKRKLDGDDEYFNTTTTTTTSTTTPTTSAAQTTTVIPLTTTTSSTTAPSTTTSDYNSQNDDPNVDDNSTPDNENEVKYDGDYETVEEHENRKKKSESEADLPTLPPFFPTREEDIYEEDRRRREEERKQYEEERRRQWEEENERRRWEEERRREEERIRREEEIRRRIWEEEDRLRREEASRRNTTTSSRPTDEFPQPTLCNGSFDSVATIRGELFIFKGKYVWRYLSKGNLVPGYPQLTHIMFNGLPHSIEQIDAVYERKNDSYIVFFIGQHFYVHDGVNLRENSPQSLMDYNLPAVIRKIDAIFVWPKNMKTYLFRRNLYWRRDDFSNSPDENYPRHIDRWNGLPPDLDAAFTDIYGYSYFFKGKEVWPYDNQAIRPMPNVQNIREWVSC